MANYSSLLSQINTKIKTNGTGAITGQLLQTILDAMVASLGAGYQYAGVATPSTNPGTPDQNVFYIATTPGTYTNFGNIVVASGECVVLKGTGSSWTKEDTGIDLVTISQNTSTGHTDISVGGVTTPVASADEMEALDQEVNGVSDYVPVPLSLSADHYRGVTSGGTKISSATTAREGTYCAVIACSPGDKFKVYGKGSAAIRLYVFADSSQNILLSNSGTIDTRTSGLEITAPADTTNLYLNFLDYDSATDKLKKYTVDGGIISRIVNLENNVLEEGDIVDNLTSDDATKALSAKQGKVLQDTKVDKTDIVDNLTTDDSTKPLSAKQGLLLNTKIVGSNEYLPQTLSLLTDQYYPSVYSYTMMSTTASSRSGTKCCIIPAVAGEKYRIYGKGSLAIKLYAFTDSSQLILLGNEGAVNTRTDGLELTAPAGTAYLFINFLDYDSSTDKLYKRVVSPGLEQDIDALQQDIEDLQDADREIRVYSGKKIIAFGDSITEFKWDGGDGKGWVDHASEILDCEFVNVAIGGAHMNVRYEVELFDSSHSYAVGDYVFHKPADTMNIYKCINAHSGAWNASDFEDMSSDATTIGGVAYNPLFVWGMVQAFCNTAVVDPQERFKNQIAAAECIYTWKSSHDDNRAIIQTLVNTDPDDISAIVILHGANDYATYGYWGTSGSFDTTTLLGAINQSVKQLNTVFKDKPIFYVTPPVRWFNYSGGTGLPQDFSDYYRRDESAPKTYKEFVYEILANEYKLDHVPVCDLYGELQWTMWNFSEYFPSNDGTHPRPGFSRIGAKIASFLLAKNVLK